MDINSLEEWEIENKMEINPGKSKAERFTKTRVKEQIKYYFGAQLIPHLNTFKYLRIIISSNLNWADHVSYTLRNSSKVLYFTIRTLKWEIIIRSPQLI